MCARCSRRLSLLSHLMQGLYLLESQVRNPWLKATLKVPIKRKVRGFAMTIRADTNGFSVGDWVRCNWAGARHEGEIVGIQTIAEVKMALSGNTFPYNIDVLEPADRPKPKLTQEQAWTELPILVAELIKDKAWVSALSKDKSPVIYETERTEIRHQAYILLGGADPRIDIAEPVKERVRDVIERMAAILGVRYL